MTTEPRYIGEIHAIRDRIYEETKDMTLEERADYINRRTDPVIAKYGMKVASPEELARARRRARRMAEPELAEA